MAWQVVGIANVGGPTAEMEFKNRTVREPGVGPDAPISVGATNQAVAGGVLPMAAAGHRLICSATLGTPACC
jgi:hypothetical protein